jgi:hypothetical protein
MMTATTYNALTLSVTVLVLHTATIPSIPSILAVIMQLVRVCVQHATTLSSYLDLTAMHNNAMRFAGCMGRWVMKDAAEAIEQEKCSTNTYMIHPLTD